MQDKNHRKIFWTICRSRWGREVGDFRYNTVLSLLLYGRGSYLDRDNLIRVVKNYQIYCSVIIEWSLYLSQNFWSDKSSSVSRQLTHSFPMHPFSTPWKLAANGLMTSENLPLTWEIHSSAGYFDQQQFPFYILLKIYTTLS